MKKKSQKVTSFLAGLHDFIVTNPQFRRGTSQKSESAIQTEIRPLLIRYLEEHFRAAGFKDAVAKANASFYWEGQEGQYGRQRATTFGSRNYPDFIITAPYLVAIEYKKSPHGSVVKHGIGQSIVHTMSGDFDYVYFLFHDESGDGRIRKSLKKSMESSIREVLWREFNVFLRFVGEKRGA